MRALVLAAIAALALPAHGQGRQDPNLAHPHEVLTVKRDGYTIAGLVAFSKAESPKYGIALFPGLHEVPYGEIAAASVVATLPVVALAFAFQRRIVEGLTAGAVKG